MKEQEKPRLELKYTTCFEKPIPKQSKLAGHYARTARKRTEMLTGFCVGFVTTLTLFASFPAKNVNTYNGEPISIVRQELSYDMTPEDFLTQPAPDVVQPSALPLVVDNAFVAEWTQNKMTGLFSVNSDSVQQTYDKASAYMTTSAKRQFFYGKGQDYMKKVKLENFSLLMTPTSYKIAETANSDGVQVYHMTMVGKEVWLNPDKFINVESEQNYKIKVIVNTNNSSIFISNLELTQPTIEAKPSFLPIVQQSSILKENKNID